MSAEETAFLWAIAEANPDDHEPRRQYAIWLEQEGRDDDADHQRNWYRTGREVEIRPGGDPEARAWLKQFAGDIGVDVDDMLFSAREFLRTGHGQYLPDGNLGFTAEGAVYDSKPRQEFWDNYEKFVGARVGPRERDDPPFVCGC